MADPSTAPPLTRASVQAAHELIKPYIHETPVLTNSTLNRLASTPRTPAELEGTEWAGRTPSKPVIRFWFKCENFQKIGAFKARGAFHAIERLKQEPGWVEGGGRERGVVTHSSGEPPCLPFSSLFHLVFKFSILTTPGNHAQALSLAASLSSIPAHIIMPTISTPSKIAATRSYTPNICTL